MRLQTSATRFCLLLWLATGLLAGCAGFEPRPIERTELLQRAQTRTNGSLSVTVAVPSADETRELFDSDLYAEGIQPVWIEIRNGGDQALWFHPHGVDADYFPPLEVARRSHRTLAGKTNRDIDAFFYNRSIPLLVPAHGNLSGFVFVNLSQGIKYVPVKLYREGATTSFEFFVGVPGFPMDYATRDLSRVYSADQILDIQDGKSLRKWIERLPCCTTNADGTRNGDPLNFVLIASEEAFISGFLRAGWDQTTVLSAASGLRTASAALLGKTYANAPISALYALGRSQDIGLQKARDNIKQRNHLRAWLAPVTYRGTRVWIGQISRDIGFRMTAKSPTFTTHKIDPDVDEARDVLALDLANARSVAAFGLARGMEQASPDAPHENLTGDPYFTDGLRSVLFLTETPTPIEKVRYLHWEALTYSRATLP
jgi:hypothetical protein